MRRYFFHIVSSEAYIRDVEGSDFETLVQARLAAIEAARELMAERILRGQNPFDGRIDVADEAGNVGLVVPFEQAINPKISTPVSLEIALLMLNIWRPRLLVRARQLCD